MTVINSKPLSNDILTISPGLASPQFQLYLDDITTLLNRNLLGAQVSLTSYTVATLPVVTEVPGMIFVSDEADGSVMAFSDGSSWRRCTDRQIVS